MNRQEREAKIKASMERQLQERGYTTSEETLMDIGLLDRKDLEAWKKGKVHYLEAVCHGNLAKLSYSLYAMKDYAKEKGLKPSVTAYKGRRFTKSGDTSLEMAYATHYVNPALKKAAPSPSQADGHPLK